MSAERWYYRCLDCLSTFAADGPEIRKAECGACLGPIETMGRVSGHRLAKLYKVCACDYRCTGALGPSCDCHCMGENHGTGRLVEVRKDCGPLPRFGVKAKAQALADAAEWRAARDNLAELIQVYTNRRESGWLSEADFYRWRQLQNVHNHARGLRTHKARMESVRSVLPALAAQSAPAELFTA